MLRALGLKQNSLIVLLLIQAMIFALPGMALGLIVSYFLNIIVAFIVFGYAHEVDSYQLNYMAIITVIKCCNS